MKPPIASATLALLFAVPAHSRDLVPEYWLENIEAADGSVQQYLVFRTVKGVRYTVEKSADLTTWEPEESFASGGEVYGLSQECVVALRQFAPPPSGSGSPTSGPPRINVSLKLQPSSGPAGGTVATWPSLSGSGSASFVLEEEMDEAWESVHSYVSSYGDYLDIHGGYRAMVWHPTEAVSPPSPSAMAAEDLEFKDVLIGAFESMNDQVAASLAQARNAPPSLPPSSDSRSFWRIRADWYVDSDLDGSPDWLENEILEKPDHPFHYLANPFDADVDRNGVPDGDQLDADLDGTPDAQDPNPTNSTFNQPVDALPRYALFPITSAQAPPEDRAPLMINDRGRVLYLNGTWSAGTWKRLENENQGRTLTGAKARSMNDLDEIVGWGRFQAQPDPLVEADHVAYWTTPTAKPAPLINGSMYAAKPMIEFVSPVSGFRASPHLSNDGQIIVNACEIGIGSQGGDPGFLFLPGNNRYIWTLPGEGRVPSHIPVGSGMVYIKSDELYWGIDPQDQSKGVISGLNDPEGFFGAPVNVFEPTDPTVTTGEGTIAFSTIPSGFVFNPQEEDEEENPEEDEEEVYKGPWKSLLIGSAIDMSDDRSIIKASSEAWVAPIILNGEVVPLVKAAPGTGPFPASDNRYINKETALLDTTPGGWILAKNGPTGHAPGDDYSALLL